MEMLVEEPPRRTRVFLSYSRQDDSLATSLRRDLEAVGLEVFRDVDNTTPGEEWWHRLMALIAQADAFVFLMSPRSCASRVCIDEVEHARGLNKRIFPVVVEAVDWNSVPDGIAKIHSVSLLDSANRGQAVADLVKAVGTDIAWVREHTRLFDRALQWRSKGHSSAELLVDPALEEAERWIASKPALAEPPTTRHYEYIRASRDADLAEQRRRLEESEEQRRILQDQKDRAEASFRAGLDVVSEAHAQLIAGLNNTRGVSLATRESITTVLLQATQRLQEAGPDFYPSSVQMQLAGNELYATVSLAEIFVAQGELTKAEETAKTATALAERFRTDEYNPLQWRSGLRQVARMLATLGDIKLRQGNFDEAIRYLLNSISVREQGVDFYSRSSPATDFRLMLADGHQRLAVAYLMADDSARALEVAKKAVSIMDRLVEESPEDKKLIVARAAMMHTVGDGLAGQGLWAEAQANYQRALDVFDGLAEQSPDDLFLLNWRSLCFERFANMNLAQGNIEESISLYEQTLAMKNQLVESDPGNAHFRNDLAIISNKLEAARHIARPQRDEDASEKVDWSSRGHC